MKNRKILVTGASGLVALPVAVELAKDNEVFALALWSDSDQKRLVEEVGASAFVTEHCLTRRSTASYAVAIWSSQDR